MSETGKVSLKCPHCGKEFQCKAPSAPGNYSVPCVNSDCRKKVSFHFPLTGDSQQVKPKAEVKFGILEDGSYRFRCRYYECRQTVLIPADMVKIGHNKLLCPKCKTPHEFKVEPTDKDRISTTPQIIRLKLVIDRLFWKKEYELTKGVHYIGRHNQKNKSDFEIKDRFASYRSVRIDVNDNGYNLVYKLTVERAMNPVYLNNHELIKGDVMCLTNGDTIKLGKTLIKVQKAQSW